MPNFQTHWLVALRALSRLEGPAKRGAKFYADSARVFRKKVHSALEAVRTEEQARAFPGVVEKAADDWQTTVLKASMPGDRKNLHDVTCFSAYMLGAAGPDFWMCPSDQAWYTGPKPDFASQHFNLGHYNRTHEQFRRSLEKVGLAKAEAQDVERSYFLGMATHIGADLVLHELVNVSAGAYNLLTEDVWRNEQTSLVFRIWNTHNKVEHWWDTYVRYRFLGDYGEVFPGRDAAWGKAHDYPLVATLLRAADAKPPAVARALREGLDRTVMRAWLEKPLVFPWVACDRILDPKSGIGPFIYRRVVDKKEGAYPKAVVYKGAASEATHFQMEDAAGGYSERKKLRYFSSVMNTPRRNPAPSPDAGVDPSLGPPPPPPAYAYEGIDAIAWNYQPFGILPGLDENPARKNDGYLRRKGKDGLVFGLDAFYDLGMLAPFGKAAVEVAGRFAARLDGAYQKGGALGDLAHFWNLDTGVGLEVQAVPTATPRDLVTRLDFVHVFDPRFHPPAFEPSRPAAPAEIAYLKGKSADATRFDQLQGGPPFPAVPGQPKFSTFRVVEETDAEKYLDRIRIGEARPPQLLAETLDQFFSDAKAPAAGAKEIESKTIADVNEVSIQDVKHRLTIEMRIAIPALGHARGEPGMFLHCDDGLKVSKAATRETHPWMSGSTFSGADGKLVDFSAEPSESHGVLRYFRSRVLVNLEKPDGFVREIAKGKWNNVVPHSKSKRFYGRNFAIGTGRRFVLHPTGSGNFDPTTDFSYYDGISPTEQTFFTLYALVKTEDGVIDAFSKEKVKRKEFDDEIVKIAAAGWVKVVLLYVLGSKGGAAQLQTCFVDGAAVPVVFPPGERG